MKKSYKLAELDCANCAAKMETAINKIPGVNKATVSFRHKNLLWTPTTISLKAYLRRRHLQYLK